ncbi:hypothetical protein Lepto7375DRAFT_0604 [Leptolyngbya sp. PCC 7375]|nr:hypothetical protein Lepto7375DRAFT_0604 [Leptolyngbya sp. PCC 7375]
MEILDKPMKIQTVEKIESLAGDNYFNLVDQALRAVDELDVEYAAFDFNGVEVCVNQSTDLVLLLRDRNTAMILDWPSIGPYCVEEYSDTVLEQIETARQEREAEVKLAQQKWQLKSEKAKLEIIAIGAEYFNFKIPLRKQFDYGLECVNRSSLPEEGAYQAAVFRWAKEIAKTTLALSRQSGRWLGVHIKEASFLVDDAMDEGFTGFQYSLAIDILERYWLYGDVVKRARQMGLV